MNVAMGKISVVGESEREENQERLLLCVLYEIAFMNFISLERDKVAAANISELFSLSTGFCSVVGWVYNVQHHILCNQKKCHRMHFQTE